jgi:peptide/nickel transport system substrate-binding protein
MMKLRLPFGLLAVAFLFWQLFVPAVSITEAGAQSRDTIVLGMTLEPPHLDPTAGAAAAIDEVVYSNVFQGLTRIDRDGVVRPQLATNWDVSADGLVYTFDLKGGVTFHDGTAFDSRDVVFSIERARAEDSTNAQKRLFDAVERVQALDPQTARVTLSRPQGSFLFNLAWGDAVIVSRQNAESNQTNPIGTGPFKFVRWVPGDRVELAAIDPGNALQAVTFRIIAEPAAQQAALLSGDVDGFANFGAPESVPLFRADRRFAVVIGTTEGETILSTNNLAPPFDDIRVRQAVAHAIDRGELIAAAQFGLGTPIGTHFAPHHPAYVDLTDRYPTDLERARELLDEAGFPDGFAATLKLPPPAYARRGGEIIAAQLARIGIELELIPVEWPTWLEQVFRGKDYDLTIVAHTEPMDIGIYDTDDYYFQYRSEALDGVIAELDRTSDEQARFALLEQAQVIIAEDAVNGYLFQLPKIGIWSADLTGLWENSPIQANDLTEVRWQ